MNSATIFAIPFACYMLPAILYLLPGICYLLYSTCIWLPGLFFLALKECRPTVHGAIHIRFYKPHRSPKNVQLCVIPTSSYSRSYGGTHTYMTSLTERPHALFSEGKHRDKYEDVTVHCCSVLRAHLIGLQKICFQKSKIKIKNR